MPDRNKIYSDFLNTLKREGEEDEPRLIGPTAPPPEVAAGVRPVLPDDEMERALARAAELRKNLIGDWKKEQEAPPPAPPEPGVNVIPARTDWADWETAHTHRAHLARSILDAKTKAQRL